MLRDLLSLLTSTETHMKSMRLSAVQCSINTHKTHTATHQTRNKVKLRTTHLTIIIQNPPLVPSQTNNRYKNEHTIKIHRRLYRHHLYARHKTVQIHRQYCRHSHQDNTITATITVIHHTQHMQSKFTVSTVTFQTSGTRHHRHQT